jgi:hypothetical protein
VRETRNGTNVPYGTFVPLTNCCKVYYIITESFFDHAHLARKCLTLRITGDGKRFWRSIFYTKVSRFLDSALVTPAL